MQDATKCRAGVELTVSLPAKWLNNRHNKLAWHLARKSSTLMVLKVFHSGAQHSGCLWERSAVALLEKRQGQMRHVTFAETVGIEGRPM